MTNDTRPPVAVTKRLLPFPSRQVVYGDTTPEPFVRELTQTEFELRALFGDDLDDL